MQQSTRQLRMAHEEGSVYGRASTRRVWLILSGCLALLAVGLWLAGSAQAVSTDSLGSCSFVQIMGPPVNNFRSFRAYANEQGVGQSCNTGTPKNPLHTDAGKSFTVTCDEFENGVAPPGEPDAGGIQIIGVADDNGFPDGGTVIWQQNFDDCEVQQSFTVFCTSNGASGGSPRWGPFRIRVRVVDTSPVTTYDDTSESATDTGQYGAYVCDPHVDAVTNQRGGLGAAPLSFYEGGDRLFQNWTINSSTPLALSTYSNRVKCDAGTGSQSNALSSSTSVLSGAITIATPGFVQGCSIVQNLSITRFMSLTGWTSVRYGQWETGTGLPAGCVIQNSSGDVECTTGKTVTYQWAWDNIFATKINDDGAENQTCPPCSFTISLDQEFLRPRGLRNASGALVAGATATCQRTDPNGVLGGTVSHGTTDASGHGSRVEYDVSPPVGLWSATCTGTLNGNSASFVIMFNHASSFSANTGMAFIWNVTANETEGLFNVNLSMVLRLFDPVRDELLMVTPDQNPRLRVFGYNRSGDGYDDMLLNVTMTQFDGMSASAWKHNFTTNLSNLTGAAGYVSFNITGSPFLGATGYHLNWTPPALSGGGSFTPGEEAEVVAMAAFFGMPFIQVLPFLVGLLLMWWGLVSAKGALPNIFLAISSAFLTFIVVVSKADLDEITTYIAYALALLYAATTLLLTVKVMNPNIVDA